MLLIYRGLLQLVFLKFSAYAPGACPSDKILIARNGRKREKKNRISSHIEQGPLQLFSEYWLLTLKVLDQWTQCETAIVRRVPQL
jgi:hypothetical protein